MASLITDEEFLQLGMASDALASIPSQTRAAVCSAASDLALSYVAKRYATPLVSYGDDLKRAIAHIAAWDALALRGFSPVAGSDASIERRHDNAIAWLRDVARGLAELQGVTDATPTINEAAPLVTSGEHGGTDWPIFGHGWGDGS